MMIPVGIIATRKPEDDASLVDGAVVNLDARDPLSYPGSGAVMYNTGSGSNFSIYPSLLYSEPEQVFTSTDLTGSAHNLNINPIGRFVTFESVFRITSSDVGTGDYGNTIAALAGSSSGPYLWTRVLSGKIQFLAYSNSAVLIASESAETGQIISLNTWYQVTVVASYFAESKIYLNGELVATGGAGNQGDSLSGFTINDLRSNRGLGFKGLWGASYLYKRVLTDAEIQQNYNFRLKNYPELGA